MPKTNMYRFGPKKMAHEARQRSLHNAGKLPAPRGGPEIDRAASRARLAQDPREMFLSDKKTLKHVADVAAAILLLARAMLLQAVASCCDIIESGCDAVGWYCDAGCMLLEAAPAMPEAGADCSVLLEAAACCVRVHANNDTVAK